MTDNLKKAKQLLEENNFTCVLLGKDSVYTSTVRGIKPLIQCYRENKIEAGFCAADKVVGKGAAILYVLMGARTVYAKVISIPAKKMLEDSGAEVFYDVMVEAIKNRDGSGFCPMETAVRAVNKPSEEAVCILENTLEKLSNIR